MTAARLDAATEHLLRELAPQVLGTLVRRFGDFASAEDAVQEALLAAALQWPEQGLPENPGGWLIQVATRRFTDHVRSEIARRRREGRVFTLSASDESWSPSIDSPAQVEREDTLLLLFMCCHQTLSTPSAIALTLRAVGGLTTTQIAHAFMVPEATMAQRISRAKQSIKTAGASFAQPTEAERAQRLGAVLHVLYLIFNEGYASSVGPDLQRVELAHEAIRLTRAVHQLIPQDPEVKGLLALMLLTDARRRARTGASGEIIPLEEQDRGLWDKTLIDEGVRLITGALALGTVGLYQIQAAIAAVHDEAARPEDTDWPQILALYGLLKRMSDNPMIALNHAIAAAMVHGPREGLRSLEALDGDGGLSGHHRLDAVRGHLYERAGDPAKAIGHYRAAADKTASLPERNYLLTRAAKLAAHGSARSLFH